MISLIIQSYLTILISVGLGSLFLFILGVYFIFKTSTPKRIIKRIITTPKLTLSANMKDLSAISGEDVMMTKLDLARAFIETGNKGSAKTILHSVTRQGNAAQQQEAQRLLQYI